MLLHNEQHWFPKWTTNAIKKDIQIIGVGENVSCFLREPVKISGNVYMNNLTISPNKFTKYAMSEDYFLGMGKCGKTTTSSKRGNLCMKDCIITVKNYLGCGIYVGPEETLIADNCRFIAEKGTSNAIMISPIAKAVKITNSSFEQFGDCRSGEYENGCVCRADSGELYECGISEFAKVKFIQNIFDNHYYYPIIETAGKSQTHLISNRVNYELQDNALKGPMNQPRKKKKIKDANQVICVQYNDDW